MKQLPEGDIKTDVLLFLGREDITNPRPAVVRRSVERYPNSARLQLRLGIFGEGNEREEALHRVIELDTDNALPCYLLAARAIAGGQKTQAFELLRQANRRKIVNSYPIPEDAARESPQLELLMMAVNTRIAFSTYSGIKDLARATADNAQRLHRDGRTEEALELLKDVRRMGWNVASRLDAYLLDLLVGAAVVRLALTSEKQICTEIHDDRGLALIRKEEARIAYVTGGVNAYLDKISRTLPQRSMESILPFEVWFYTLAVETMFLTGMLLWWGYLGLRSKRETASPLHEEAARRALGMGRLAIMYMSTLVPALAAATCVFWMALAKNLPILTIAGILVLVVQTLVLARWAGLSYRRAFVEAVAQAGEQAPPLDASASLADKRELRRWMSGVFGGMIALVMLCSLIYAAAAKVTRGTYPWEPPRLLTETYWKETEYAQDLLRGKAKVPQEYIDRELRKAIQTKPFTPLPER